MEFEELADEIDRKYTDLLSWAVGDSAAGYTTGYKLSKAALSEIRDVYEKTGQDKFIELIKSAIIEDTSSPILGDLFCRFDNFPDDNPLGPDNDTPGIIRDLEKSYHESLFEFNRRFLASMIHQVPINILISFLVNQIANKGLSLEFIDRIKLHPNAPSEIRNSLRVAKMSPNITEGSLSEDFTEEDRLAKDKKWYEQR